ncbi:hypothetical protein [Bacillus sp. FJAT-27445]|uniref:hypothetical protein n=1 Tax=Bacillus sp. FJAT-27445 TaxID=1679166 RepID=UPI00074338D2|nr:hypothetical protein [Bacillus sp. FJAT-27445]
MEVNLIFVKYCYTGPLNLQQPPSKLNPTIANPMLYLYTINSSYEKPHTNKKFPSIPPFSWEQTTKTTQKSFKKHKILYLKNICTNLNNSDYVTKFSLVPFPFGKIGPYQKHTPHPAYNKYKGMISVNPLALCRDKVKTVFMCNSNNTFYLKLMIF